MSHSWLGNMGPQQLVSCRPKMHSPHSPAGRAVLASTTLSTSGALTTLKTYFFLGNFSKKDVGNITVWWTGPKGLFSEGGGQGPKDHGFLVEFQSKFSSLGLVAQLVKNLPAIRETWVQSLGWEDFLEEGKATHSSILAWRIPWTVQSMGSQRVGHDWATFTSLFTFHCLGNGQTVCLSSWTVSHPNPTCPKRETDLVLGDCASTWGCQHVT